MSPLWRDELRVVLYPRRLVLCRLTGVLRRRLLARSIVDVEDNPVRRLGELAASPEFRDCRLVVILSGAYVRYRVLPWNAALASESEWLAYAQHEFGAVLGNVAAGWRICLSDAGSRMPRFACAAEVDVLDALGAIPRIASIRPGLAAAFNARRREFVQPSGWFVLQDATRLTLALFVAGVWMLTRNRQLPPHWELALPDMLDREHLIAGLEKVSWVFIHSESVVSSLQDRYQVADVTLPRDADPELRPFAMAL